MPSLRHLLDELEHLNVAPGDVRVSGQLYDELVGQAAPTDVEKAQCGSESSESKEE